MIITGESLFQWPPKDGAKELNIGKWKDAWEKYGGIKQTNTEPNSPWQNRAEAGIKELKKHVNRLMKRKHALRKLWDYCV
eukprot:15146423-Ditylum_brightwellii.AAC.1